MYLDLVNVPAAWLLRSCKQAAWKTARKLLQGLGN